MTLTIDGKPVHEGTLEAALAGLLGGRSEVLELRRKRGDWIKATRGKDGLCMLELSRDGAIIGISYGRRDAVAIGDAFRDFLRGNTPSFRPRSPAELRGQGITEIVIGDPYRDDCPLCRMS